MMNFETPYEAPAVHYTSLLVNGLFCQSPGMYIVDPSAGDDIGGFIDG